MSTLATFSSKAWLLDGPIFSIPGILHLAEDQLTYLVLEYGTFSHEGLKKLVEVNDGSLESDEAEFPLALFTYPTGSLTRFHIPWYYFGGGAKITIGGRTYRFSFVRPQNTVEPSYYSEYLHRWLGGKGQEEVNITEGRASGKRWRSLLSR